MKMKTVTYSIGEKSERTPPPSNDTDGHDPVNHPSHYMGNNGIEVIDVIEGFELNYQRGNVCKYLLRAGRKENELEDLKKAATYLQREIARLSKTTMSKS